MTTRTLTRLGRAGVSVWLDDLNRGRLTSGSLVGLVRYREVTGVDTNPVSFARALAVEASLRRKCESGRTVLLGRVVQEHPIDQERA